MNAHFESLLTRAESLIARIELALPQPLTAPDWTASIAFRYRKRSAGRAVLEPVRQFAGSGHLLRLRDLQEIDSQKEKIQRNTLQFVQGLPANNVLLTGARGTGKSSLIKACLHAYAAQGLRLIEVDKADLCDLPDIVELISERPEKFIIFCDDLSFEEGESGYKALKSVLDGSIAAPSPNMLIYATSNRRHLLPERMSENLTYTHTEDGEVHPGEVIEEKISLSERFGLWVSFYPFSQDEYLAIAAQWLASFGIAGDAALAQARPRALVWALERGSRSGRVAWQFARDYAGQQQQASVQTRPVVEVAVGILLQPDGSFLLTSRPPGKVYAGYWEFPGGKIETGESVEVALKRELQEEIGITIGNAPLWRSTLVDYPHALVRLHFCKVHVWTGELQMREGQQYAWQSLPVAVQPVLPGTLPVLDWLAAERGLAATI